MTGLLVVGLGEVDRGDDGVGVVAARRVAALRLPGVVVAAHHDPAALLDVWEGHDRVVVLDAVCSGSAPGMVHRLLVGAGQPPLPVSAWAATGQGGTHAFGLATVVELARALHRLPAHVVVLGVEAVSFHEGEPLSEAVAAAVPGLVERVVAEAQWDAPAPRSVEVDDGVPR
jgi:hydrogenase maturation protease